MDDYRINDISIFIHAYDYNCMDTFKNVVVLKFLGGFKIS